MPEVILTLIAEIYGQLRAATEENARLKNELAALKKEA